MRPHVAVLGGGIQGTTIALELDARGCTVDLYEAADTLISGVSLHNEGKIHLGYTYAAGTPATIATMIAGALGFRSTLERWLDPGTIERSRSNEVVYAVPPDSLLGPDRLHEHYRRVDAAVTDALADGGDYLGATRLTPTRRLHGGELDAFDTGFVRAAFATAERSLDPRPIAEGLRSAVGASRIRVRTGTRAVAVDPGRPLRVLTHEGERDGYDHVVNALWGDRLRVDGTMGLTPARPWLFRCKYGVRVYDDPVDIPTTTLALGPFGDAVRQADHVYLSWYPAGRIATSSDLAPPPWPAVLEGRDADDIAATTIEALARYLPALGALNPEGALVSGGPIFAWAHSDLDDPATHLHERAAIGPSSHGSYHTVDTGKYTCAPGFAVRLADRIAPR